MNIDGVEWTLDGESLTSADGREIRVALGTTEEQAAAIIARFSRPSIPIAVPMAEARKVLLLSGRFAAVDSAIRNMPGIEGDLARTDWDYQPNVRRDSPLVQSMIQQLGWSDEEVDQLFLEASR